MTTQTYQQLINEGIKASLVKKELKELSLQEEKHLEAEFEDYKKHYPRRNNP